MSASAAAPNRKRLRLLAKYNEADSMLQYSDMRFSSKVSHFARSVTWP